MPIEKVRVRHKFGIISHFHRHELLERMSASAAANPVSPRSALPQPCEITHEFITAYNTTHPLDRKALERQAEQLLERIKRRAGLGGKNDGNNTHIPRAWVELCLMARCNGPIRNQVYLTLFSSLLTSKISVTNIPSLFLIAETVLDWVKALAVPEGDIPWSREHVLILYIAETCFTRIFIHSVLYNLQGCDSFLMDLNWHLDNLDFIKKVYSQFLEGEMVLEHITSIKAVTVGLIEDSKNVYKTIMGDSLMHCLEYYQSHSIGRDLNTSLSSLLCCVVVLGSDSHVITDMCWRCLAVVCRRSLLSLQVLQTAAAASLPLAPAQNNTTSGSNSIGVLHFRDWPWVAAVQYVRLMEDVAVHGTTSDVRRGALVAGKLDTVKVDGVAAEGIALFDIVQMHVRTPLRPSVVNALRSALVSISRHVEGDALRESVGNAARAKLRLLDGSADHTATVANAEVKCKVLKDAKIVAGTLTVYQQFFTLLADYYFPKYNEFLTDLKTPSKNKKLQQKKSPRVREHVVRPPRADGHLLLRDSVNGEEKTSTEAPKLSEQDARSIGISSSGYERVLQVMSASSGRYEKVQLKPRRYPIERPRSYKERNDSTLSEMVKDQWYKELMEVFRAAEKVDQALRDVESEEAKEKTRAELLIEGLEMPEEDTVSAAIAEGAATDIQLSTGTLNTGTMEQLQPPDTFADFATYEDFLNSQITAMDLYYLEDEELARQLVELGYRGSGEVLKREEFEVRKQLAEASRLSKRSQKKTLASAGKDLESHPLLKALAEREEANKTGKMTSIIFIRDKNVKGQEISGYIDYAHRLKTEDFEAYFNLKKRLLPKPSDLSFYNWETQNSTSNGTPNYQVIADNASGLLFKNKRDRKILNVDPKAARPGDNSTRIPIDGAGHYIQVVIYDHITRRKT